MLSYASSGGPDLIAVSGNRPLAPYITYLYVGLVNFLGDLAMMGPVKVIKFTVAVNKICSVGCYGCPPPALPRNFVFVSMVLTP